ncbi:MAG: GAF domain-containing SpoIIE family protein phosphatase [Planctomycetota bacterium]
MSDTVLKGEILSRLLEVVGKGTLREALLFDAAGRRAVSVPIGGSGSERGQSLESLLLAERQFRESGAGAAVRVLPLTLYGQEAGHLALLGEPGTPDATLDEVIADAADLVMRLAEMNLEIESLSNEVLRSYEAINFFYDMHSALAGSTDPAVLCRTILDRLLATIACQSGLIVLVDEARDRRAQVRALRAPGAPLVDGMPIEASTLLLGEVLETGRSVVIDDAGELARDELGPLASLARLSLVLVPLRWEGRSLGAIVLADRFAPECPAAPVPFTSAELKLLETIATQAASILSNMKLMELKREIEIARRIQSSLLPERAPVIPGADLSGRCLMASGVGGDLFDFSAGTDGRTWVVVADVSGHNLASALMMAVARTALKIAGRSRRSPAAIARRVNADLYDDLAHAELFITFFLATYEPERRLLSYCSAGHNPAVLLRAGSGRLETLKAAGVPAGILPSFEFEERSTRLHPEDVLVITTDGVTEARSPAGEMLGEEGLVRALRGRMDGTAAQILEGVLADIERFTAGQGPEDDRTLVVLKIGNPRTAAGRGQDSRPSHR